MLQRRAELRARLLGAAAAAATLRCVCINCSLHSLSCLQSSVSEQRAFQAAQIHYPALRVGGGDLVLCYKRQVDFKCKKCLSEQKVGADRKGDRQMDIIILYVYM